MYKAEEMLTTFPDQGDLFVDEDKLSKTDLVGYLLAKELISWKQALTLLDVKEA